MSIAHDQTPRKIPIGGTSTQKEYKFKGLWNFKRDNHGNAQPVRESFKEVIHYIYIENNVIEL
jgi:hypothetical protein